MSMLFSAHCPFTDTLKTRCPGPAATVPGGVYSPVEWPLLAMLPPDPAASDHVTDVSAAPLTAAVNCAACGVGSVPAGAVTVTDTTSAPLCATISMASILAAP